jgi:hypothetical protein
MKELIESQNEDLYKLEGKNDFKLIVIIFLISIIFLLTMCLALVKIDRDNLKTKIKTYEIK